MKIYFHLNIFEEISFDDHVHICIYIANIYRIESKLFKYDDLFFIDPVRSIVKNNRHYLVTLSIIVIYRICKDKIFNK